MKNKVQEFILKSKKVYAILFAGIMICLCLITANVSYKIGEQNAAGYSKEYMECYGVHMIAYTNAGTPFETADSWARQISNMFVGK